MPPANLMRILYKKGILNEADPMSRRPDFLLVDNMRMPDERLYWDGNGPDIDTNSNDPPLLALSTLEILNINDDFLSKLKKGVLLCLILKGD